MLMGMASCSMESPFTVESGEGTGRLLKSNIALDVKGVNPITKALTAGVPEVSDFKVEIYKEDQSISYQTYESYGSMPEVISLPEGEYSIKVSYGGSYGNETSNAAFNTPYYLGESDKFKVEIDKIVSNIKPIVCKLQNVRVKVNFDVSLSSVMSEDSKVNVQLGNGTVLSYTKNTTEDGFFEFPAKNTVDQAENAKLKLTATFIGTVEGIEVNEAKSFDKVEAGNYYIITFKLHNADASNPGNIVPGGSEDGNGFTVDASVGYTDMNESNNTYDPSLNPDEPNNRYVEDDMRPENGQTPGSGDDEPGKEDPEDPNNPNEPNIPDIPKKSFSVEVTPANQIQHGESGNNIYGQMPECKMNVVAEEGIKNFEIEVYSKDNDSLNTTLQAVFGDKIDLVNKPADPEIWEMLESLNVPLDLGGKTNVEIILSDFFKFVDEGFSGSHVKFTIYIADKVNNSETIILNVEFPSKD